MNSSETDMPFGRFVDRLGTAVLVFVAFAIVAVVAVLHVWVAGIDNMLDRYRSLRMFDTEAGRYLTVPLRVHIDFVTIPLAAIAAVWLRWGADWIAAPRAPREIRARPRWGDESTPPPRASTARHLFPLVGAVVLFGVVSYWVWWGFNPHYLFGIPPHIGVQRWISVTLMAGVGYSGMILFPRLTAWLAGAVAGPTLFAVVGYTLFPSFLEAASKSRYTSREAEEHLADTLVVVFDSGAVAVAIAAIVAMILSKRLRGHPLSYALWMGAFMLCLAASGTFNGHYPGG